MRILLVYPDIVGTLEQPIGLMYISAILKFRGHETALFDFSGYTLRNSGDREREIKRDFIYKIKTFDPDIIGFSVVSPLFQRAKTYARLAKELCDAKILFGGAHPTVEPMGTIKEPVIDFVCVGEGEEAVAELVSRIEENGDIANIENIWSKDKGQFKQNPVRPLVQDLDSLPYVDRALLDQHYRQGRIRAASFITSRGCPYACAFCHNPYLQELYKGKGRFIRFRKPENVIAEIQNVLSQYNVEHITFSDDSFTLRKDRLLEFCELYRKEVGLPYICQARVDAMDEEVLMMLKESGCSLVSIGIEAGNDTVRNEVLNKALPRDKILKGVELAKQVGLRVGSFNMVGVPTETESTIWDTINLNREIAPDIMNTLIFMPLKGSPLHKVCEENNYIRKEPTTHLEYAFESSTLKLPTISGKKLFAYVHLFDLYVHANQKHFWLINILRRLWQLTPEGDSPVAKIIRGFILKLTNLLRRVLPIKKVDSSILLD